MKPTALDIEIGVARYFCWRRNVIVPNVSWGWGLNYEADVVVLTPRNYCFEVEIKTTASDLRADLRKRHHHDDNRFKRLYFAVPQCLADAHFDLIPPRAGILALQHHANGGGYYMRLLRAAATNTAARPISEEERMELLKLAHMRVWTLKQALQTRIKREALR